MLCLWASSSQYFKGLYCFKTWLTTHATTMLCYSTCHSKRLVSYAEQNPNHAVPLHLTPLTTTHNKSINQPIVPSKKPLKLCLPSTVGNRLVPNSFTAPPIMTLDPNILAGMPIFPPTGPKDPTNLYLCSAFGILLRPSQPLKMKVLCPFQCQDTSPTQKNSTTVHKT
jgi:hypothetical protein